MIIISIVIFFEFAIGIEISIDKSSLDSWFCEACNLFYLADLQAEVDNLL